MTDDVKDRFGQRDYQLRKQLYDQAGSVKWGLFYTYKRNYVAAEWVGRFGWALDIFIVFIGSILLYITTREGTPDFALFRPFSALSPTDLALIILIGSLLSSFYGPKLRSRDYYNAGQELQELTDEVDYFICQRLTDPDVSIQDLQEEFNTLQDRRHRLNQSTPQLGGHWYRLMKWKDKYKKLVPWESVKDSSQPSFKEFVQDKTK
ncbi:hypothetical protein [Haloterrigena salinisoli]|uniref:hypothetical protein n=1 Tax=Haloterrigena salinisoli TaxID=3132747 RepID=UPI0030CDC01F